MGMNKTKIDWCDASWNPVHGCLQDPPCPYCYARKMARRWGDKDFKPTWKQTNFNRPFSVKPSRIFVNSMSDIASWKDGWMAKVLYRITNNPQHTFFLLTKQPRCYLRIDGLVPRNCWLGVTITDQAMMNNAEETIPDEWQNKERPKRFYSMEPLHEDIEMDLFPDWIIVGAETGNSKDKIIPKYSWIENIVVIAGERDIPIFLKENLADIWKRELIQEYPR